MFIMFYKGKEHSYKGGFAIGHVMLEKGRGDRKKGKLAKRRSTFWEDENFYFSIRQKS
jgi:hypothetical protein